MFLKRPLEINKHEKKQVVRIILKAAQKRSCTFQHGNMCTNPVPERLQDAPDILCGHVHTQLLPGFPQSSGYHISVRWITLSSCKATNNL